MNGPTCIHAFPIGPLLSNDVYERAVRFEEVAHPLSSLSLIERQIYARDGALAVIDWCGADIDVTSYHDFATLVQQSPNAFTKQSVKVHLVTFRLKRSRREKHACLKWCARFTALSRTVQVEEDEETEVED